MLLQVSLELGSLDQLLLDWNQELTDLLDHVFIGNSNVPVQEVEQLSLHQVDVLQRKKPIGVLSPMDIFRRRIVVEFGSEDQTTQEDAVSGTRQALSVLWKLQLQLVQVNKSSHQCACVDIGVADQATDECHQRGQGLLARGALNGFILSTRNHLQRCHDQFVDHLMGDWTLNEDAKSFQVGRGGHCGELGWLQIEGREGKNEPRE